MSPRNMSGMEFPVMIQTYQWRVKTLNLMYQDAVENGLRVSPFILTTVSGLKEIPVEIAKDWEWHALVLFALVTGWI